MKHTRSIVIVIVMITACVQTGLAQVASGTNFQVSFTGMPLISPNKAIFAYVADDSEGRTEPAIYFRNLHNGNVSTASILKDFSSAQEAQVWSASLTDTSLFLAVILVLPASNGDPVTRNLILRYAPDASLKEVWDTGLFACHDLAADNAGVVYCLSKNEQVDLAIGDAYLMKYSAQGRLLAQFPIKDAASNVTPIHINSNTGSNHLAIGPEGRVAIYLAALGELQIINSNNGQGEQHVQLAKVFEPLKQSLNLALLRVTALNMSANGSVALQFISMAKDPQTAKVTGRSHILFISANDKRILSWKDAMPVTGGATMCALSAAGEIIFVKKAPGRMIYISTMHFESLPDVPSPERAGLAQSPLQ